MTHRFNPHPRTGGDLQHTRVPSAQLAVSIHTPARGVTAYNGSRSGALKEFQSTPPHGG